MCVVWLLLCDGQRPISRGFGTVRNRTLCSRMEKSRAEWQTGVCPYFRTPLLIGRINFGRHNFLVRTPICVFLDSTKSSLSLEFNEMKCSAKRWAKHWGGSRTVEEWSVLVSGTSVFGTGLYPKCLGLRMA